MTLANTRALTHDLFLPVPDDYRAIVINATHYTVSVTVTADTRDGEPILIFTVFINNTFRFLETNTNHI